MRQGEQPNYYAILIADVRYSKELNFFEKVLLADITALTNKDGYCTASNGYFAELFGKTKETISRAISKFEKLGFLKVVLIYKNNTKEVHQRRLYLLTKISIPLDVNINTPCDFHHYPLDVNRKDNNININTTSNNKKNIQKKEKKVGNKSELKEFSFTLSKKMQIENTSVEYKEKLKEYIQNSNKPISYADFYNACVAKGYRYKNFKAAYDKWTVNKKYPTKTIKKGLQQKNEEILNRFFPAEDIIDVDVAPGGGARCIVSN